jgi:hypothetical protein
MYLGLERAAQKTGKKISLIMAGWFANEAIKNEFVTAAKTFAPSVNTIFIDGRKKEVRETIWFAADVFTSLSDNIQETFGLTPIEAMAAGLPVVCSDWDGYRETVRHGVDGFLIPTWMQAPGGAEDLAFLNATGQIDYDHYIGCQSQFTAVDVDESTRGFLALIESPQLRLQMGSSAKQRAKAVYDWKWIVKAYEMLFSEVTIMRKETLNLGTPIKSSCPNPLRQDPTALFQAYPTSTVALNTAIRANASCCKESIANLHHSSMNSFAFQTVGWKGLPTESVNECCNSSFGTVGELCASSCLQNYSEASVSRLILWLTKMGAITLRSEPS